MDETKLRAVLQWLGYEPRPKSWGLLVRLPLWCDLRIRPGPDGAPRIEPYFGSTPRSLHSWLMPVLYLLLLVLLLQNPNVDVPHFAAMVVLFLLASAWDVCRYIVTEGALTRITVLMAMGDGEWVNG